MLNIPQCPLCAVSRSRVRLDRQDKRLGRRTYYSCDECGLVYLEPVQRLDLKNERTRYDLHQNSPEDQRYLQFLSRLVNPLKTKLKPKARILDFGCGPGPAVGALLKGMDVMLSNYDPYYCPDRDLLRRKYDCIVSTEVIEHLHNPREELLRLKDLLDGQGSCLAVMTQVIPKNQSFEEWWYHREPTHVCFYSRETFDWIARWLGLRAEYPQESVVFFTWGAFPENKERVDGP